VKLLSIIPSTIERALKAKKGSLKRGLYGRTKPGTLMRPKIPEIPWIYGGSSPRAAEDGRRRVPFKILGIDSEIMDQSLSTLIC